MKTIKPLNIWINGESKTVNKFKLTLVSDDLNSHAVFYYELSKDDDLPIVNGNIHIKDSDYESWDNSNEQAFVICASKLNIEII